MNIFINKGVELSQGADGRISLPAIALASFGLMYLGKKSGDYLKQKIGEANTVGLTIFGLLAGISTGASAAIYAEPSLVYVAGGILVFSTGMTMSTNSNKKI